MRMIYWIIPLILSAPAAMFALSNRETVVVHIWPLPFEVPVVTYLLVFVPFLLGFGFGGLAAWWAGGKHRRRARQAERRAGSSTRRVQELETEVERLKSPQSESTALPAVADAPDARSAA